MQEVQRQIRDAKEQSLDLHSRGYAITFKDVCRWLDNIEAAHYQCEVDSLRTAVRFANKGLLGRLRDAFRGVIK